MGWLTPSKVRMVSEPRAIPATPVVYNAGLPDYRWQYGYDDGSKWQGGFGPTRVNFTDYWSLRARSVDLFETNLYARGIIRRLVTNIINTGLHLESVPDEGVLGKKENALAPWSEEVENRFAIWGNEPRLCDYAELRTFGALQVAAKVEALIAGDVLVVNRTDQRTGLPKIQLVSGSCIQNPLGFGQQLGNGNRIDHGVERDAQGRHIAYWIQQRPANGFGLIEYKRLPAYGEKSGRRLAWLVYGTDKKLDDVRGKPVLSLVLQSLKEIDRYRDSTQRKAVINSMLAMVVTKKSDKPGTKPLTGMATRRGTETAIATDGTRRCFKVAEQVPGFVIDELQTGEDVKSFGSNGTDERFGAFEAAVVQGIAWGLEIPPEILMLSFNNNYSASQAALNEFKMFLNKERVDFGDTFCDPIYREWLLGEVLSDRIQAQGLVESSRDALQYATFGAWMAADWTGQIKPAVDLSKLVAGYAEAIEKGLITRARAARELFGTRYSKVIQQLALENEALFHANHWLSELKAIEKAPANAAEPSQEAKDNANPDGVNSDTTNDDGSSEPAKNRIRAAA